MEIICSHSNCDLDAFSSMLALQILFPKAEICIIGATDEVIQDLLKDYPDKFKYIKEKNLVPEKVKSVILVDNTNYNRLGKLGKFLKNNPEIPVICYDHHERLNNSKHFMYYHQENLGSCVSLIMQDIMERNINIEPFLASILALGIYEDTGSFLAVDTNSKDFTAMAYLMSMGASINLIKKYIKPKFNAIQIKLMNYLLSSMEILEIKGIQIHFFKVSMDEHYQNLSVPIQHLKQSEKIKCLFCFAEMENKVVVIARSDYNFIEVNTLLKPMGGGGHPSSASATIGDMTIEEVQGKVIELVAKAIEAYGTVKDIMTSPVEMIDISSSIQEVSQILSNSNFGAIPISREYKMVGIVTKKDIGQATFHGLGQKSIECIMSTDLITLEESISIIRAQEIMVEKDIGRIPIMRNGDLIGIISRQDILRDKIMPNYTQRFYYENVSNKLKQLPAFIQKSIEKVSLFADSLNVNAYLVGGFVRDLLMHKSNIDIDIVIEGDAVEFAEKFSKKFKYHFMSFPKFKTAIVSYPQIKKIDFASARSEVYEQPGMLPKVHTSSIRNDLFRRDFTMNSMAIQINQESFGKLFDYFNGRRDIQLGVLRILNNMSFSDDPTRILRAIRFEQRFMFKIDQKTLHLLQKFLHLNSLANIAVERVQQELIKGCEEMHVNRFFNRLHELGILKKILSNLNFSPEKNAITEEVYPKLLLIREKNPHLDFNVWVIYHLILASDLSLRSQIKFAEQYKYPKLLSLCFEELGFLKDLFSESADTRKTKGDYALILKGVKPESIMAFLLLEKNELIRKFLSEYLMELSVLKPELDGKMLIKMGLKPSVDLGNLLELLYIGKVNKILKNKEDEINYAKQYIKQLHNR